MCVYETKDGILRVLSGRVVYQGGTLLLHRRMAREKDCVLCIVRTGGILCIVNT